MELAFRSATPSDAGPVSSLIHASFLEFVAPEWEAHAVEKFLQDSTPKGLADLIGMAAFAAVACAGDEPVGFILLAPPNQLKAMFVARPWHRRGIARKLWSLARSHLKANQPAVETIELNASGCAVETYKALGFYPISKPFRRQGCLSTRMACWLPACEP